jgi:phosphoglycolate phosphatase
MKYDIVAFDFDGTLADTLPWIDSILEEVANKYGFRKPNAADKALMRQYDIQNILKLLGIPLWKLPAILTYIRRLMQEIEPSVQLFDGMPAMLVELKAAGLHLAVVSSNSLTNVQRVLGPEISQLFDDFLCGAHLFGKPAKILRLLRRYAAVPTRLLLVGDEIRDIDAARKVGVCIGCGAWGYNNINTLCGHTPDEIFTRVTELRTLLN